MSGLAEVVCRDQHARWWKLGPLTRTSNTPVSLTAACPACAHVAAAIEQHLAEVLGSAEVREAVAIAVEQSLASTDDRSHVGDFEPEADAAIGAIRGVLGIGDAT